MGWSSATTVVRVPEAVRDRTWAEVRGLVAERGRSSARAEPAGTQVCCFWLQGICRFGATCEMYHDKAMLPAVGCTFGPKCRLGHSKHLARSPEGPRRRAPLTPAQMGAMLVDDLLRSAPAGGHLECLGPGYDDSDPVWDEVSTALRRVGEDVGDGDLPSGTRRRLAAAGQYHEIDAETADEWISVSGEELLPLVKGAEERVRQLRAEWFHYDLAEVQTLWEELRTGLRTEEPKSPRSQGLTINVKGAAFAAVRRAEVAFAGLAQAAQRLPPLVTSLPPADGAAAAAAGGDRRLPLLGGGLEAALAAAAVSAEELRRLEESRCLVWTSQGPTQGALAVGADHALEGAMQAGLAEICRGLRRCLLVGRAESHDAFATGTSAPSQRSPGDGLAAAAAQAPALKPGGLVALANLTAPCEAGLLGQAARLERFDEQLGLWQVRLEASGTRLLLEARQVVPSSSTAATNEGSTARGGTSRSRSPRGADAADAPRPPPSPGRHPRGAAAEGTAVADSLLELVAEASRRGEHVLVHHVVGWYGVDATTPLTTPWGWTSGNCTEAKEAAADDAPAGGA